MAPVVPIALLAATAAGIGWQATHQPKVPKAPPAPMLPPTVGSSATSAETVAVQQATSEAAARRSRARGYRSTMLSRAQQPPSERTILADIVPTGLQETFGK